MTIYKGSQKESKIYTGSTQISKIYKGSTLIYSSDPYPIDTVLYENSTGGATSSLNLEKGLYQVICVAGGGGAAVVYYASFRNQTSAGSGGSGAGFNCILSLDKGSYNISVGKGGTSYAKSSGQGTGGSGGNSSFGSAIAYAGTGGTAYNETKAGTGGSGGSAPYIPYTIQISTLNKKGNNGTGTSSGTISGGAAVYSSYGQGGNAKVTRGDGATYYSNAGNAGYVKVVYKGQP